MCLKSVMGNFRVLSTAPITAPSFDDTTGICAIRAVVDTRRVLPGRGVRGECSGECAACFLSDPFPNFRDRMQWLRDGSLANLILVCVDVCKFA
jgi:hypothetical protein